MHYFSTLLLVTTTGLLLAGTSACSKKDTTEPTPAITAASKMGNYTLDGTVFTGPVTYTLGQYYGGGDLLTLVIKSGPNPAQPTQEATLIFAKPSGAAVSAYTCGYVTITDNTVTPSKEHVYSSTLRYSLTQTSSGYSGTFSATSQASSTSPTASSLTAGSFADAQP